MLEAITDFWKPVKKAQPPAKLKLTDMQIGSTVMFGYVPQVALSGKKLTVSAINSYQFGQDVLTSFVLSGDNDTDVSMIIAEAQGEQYLAISRRLSESEKQRLFDADALKEITEKNEITSFKCRDNVPELKGWLVGGYKREIQGMRGFIHRADFRNGNNGSHAGAEFQYTLLGSNSNEHAIEIESYADGHIDVYATIYRRTTDIAEVVHSDKAPQQNTKQPVKVELTPVIAKAVEEPAIVPVASIAIVPETVKIDVKEEKPEPPKLELTKPEPKLESAKIEPTKPAVEPVKVEPKLESVKHEPVKLEAVPLPQLTATPLVPEIAKPEPIKNTNEEKKDMTMTTTVISNETKPSNGVVTSELPSVPSFGSSILKQEIKTVTKTTNGMDNESVECDLRVANQLIDEAIRNEMRLSDVVRRIIELPVAHQEAVQIPINLADEDYSLLAIRYGIPSSDRNAIKLRIIQELGDFSGSKKKNS